MTTEKNSKVNVEGGTYIGYSWFIKITYKIFETDVEFFDDIILLSQGTGFAKVKEKNTTSIKYKDIKSVTTKKKYSTPNVILAILAVLGALITGVWAALIVAAIIIWIGSTSATIIEHVNGVYEIPTELKSDADELQSKIYMAINQSK